VTLYRKKLGYFDLTRKNSQKNPIKKMPSATSHVNGFAKEIGSQPTAPVCEDRDAIARQTTTVMTVRIAAASTASKPATMHLR
jgi:hypothetical protein